MEVLKSNDCDKYLSIKQYQLKHKNYSYSPYSLSPKSSSNTDKNKLYNDYDDFLLQYNYSNLLFEIKCDAI